MRIKCLSCGREMNMDQQGFSDFKGSIKCFSCSAAVEIQTMRRVLICGYPLSDVNSGFAASRSEHNL